MPRQKSLRDYLANDHQRSVIQHIQDYSANMAAAGMPFNPMFTLHGPQHCEQVERIVGNILGMDNQGKLHNGGMHKVIDSDELFYLLVAVWLHDVGLYALTESEKAAAKADNGKLGSIIRDTHETRSRQYITGHYDKLHLTPEQATDIGLISEAHRQGKRTNSSLDQLPDDLRFPAAVLRIADELDMTSVRTPPTIFENQWADMDEKSRWHWLKHRSVNSAKPRHVTQMETGGRSRLLLTYDFLIFMPDDTWAARFWNKIIEPVQRVCDREGVNGILARRGLHVDYQHFTYRTQSQNESLPDGTTFRQALQIYLAEDALPREIEKVLREIERRMEPAAHHLRRLCKTMIRMTASLPDVVNIRELIVEYIRTLYESADDETAAKAFNDHAAKVWSISMQAGSADLKRELEIQWRKMSKLAWRLVKVATGDPATQRKHLSYLNNGRRGDTEMNGWFACRGADSAMRIEACDVLASLRTLNSYRYLLSCSRELDASVRLHVVELLQSFPGLRTCERLIKVLEEDRDAIVRQTAVETAKALGLPIPIPSPPLPGRRVLLINQPPDLVGPLTEKLGEVGVDVKLITQPEEDLESVLSSWKPDVVLCEMCDPMANDRTELHAKDVRMLPGYRYLRQARKQLGVFATLIATSLVADDVPPDGLETVGALHHTELTTVGELIKSLEWLVVSQPAKAGPGASDD